MQLTTILPRLRNRNVVINKEEEQTIESTEFVGGCKRSVVPIKVVNVEEAPVVKKHQQKRTAPTKSNKKALLQEKPKNIPDTWYYSSNHILVNRERALCGLPQLRRCRLLDDLARFHAQDMAEEQRLYHSVDGIEALKSKLKSSSAAGENIQRGSSIRQMHATMMTGGKTSKQNILSKNFCDFGMGTAKGADGKLYMVQLFRGRDEEQ